MAGNNILVINASGAETRVALVENGTIHEYYLERKREKGIVGNIYKCRVVRVLPGMQAAFVDIGLEKAAFLYVSDVVYDPDFARAQFELTEGEHEDAPDVPEFEPQPEPVRVEADIQELSPGELAPPEGEPVRRITAEFPAVAPPPEQPAQPEAAPAQVNAGEPDASAPAPQPPPEAT